jgi:cytochrome c554/c'-like protein
MSRKAVRAPFHPAWWAGALMATVAAGIKAADCGACHPAETHLHERSRMAHAMSPATASAFGKNLPSEPLREPGGGYGVSYQASPFGSILVTAVRGADRADGRIEWVMGAGAQGETPLVETGSGILESHVSYFPQLGRFGITIGQTVQPSTAEGALGVKQGPKTLRACIGCHATGIASDLKPVTPGVQCERCHSGAARHAQSKAAVSNPGKMTALDQVRFCGACHRDKPPVDDAQLENVRFQPLQLMKSKCFNSGQLKCTTCHAAHQDARRSDASFYNGRCLACHGGQTNQRFHLDARAQGDCIACHMPYVELHPALHFTDHDIRIVKAGDYPASMMRVRAAGS